MLDKLFLPTLVAPCALLVVACSPNAGPSQGGYADDAGVDGAPAPNELELPPADFVLFCRATTTPLEVTYTVEGDTLIVVSRGTAAATSITRLKRVGTGPSGMPIFGAWDLPLPPPSDDAAYVARTGLSVTATLIIDGSRLTMLSDCSSKWATIRAQASSPIALTSTTLEVLEAHEERRQWSRAGGEQIVGD